MAVGAPEGIGRTMARLVLFISMALIGLSTSASAQFHDNKLDQYAWACSGSYSSSPAKVLNGKDRETATCLSEGKRKPMPRSDAYDRCRKQFSATSLMLSWTRNGWYCRYHEH
jgi:hypothetical protein